MDEGKTASAPREPEKKPKNTRRRLLRRVIAGLVTLVLVTAAVLVFVYRDRLTAEGLRALFGRELSAAEESVPFTYETGANQVFAPAGNGFAVASSSSVQLLDKSGETVYKETVSFGTPAVFACEKLALFCDIGGREAVAAGFGVESFRLSFGGDILSAHMNASGWFTVISEEAGYKGLVQVYNPKGELMYKWWSGTGYALRAVVDPGNSRLAVLTVDSAGGKIHIFSLSSENELASAGFPGELLFDLYCMDGGILCAIGEEHVYFVDSQGQTVGSYDLSGRYLSDYSFGSGAFAAVCLNDYRTGTGGTIVSLDSSGQVLGSAQVDQDILSMCAAGKQLLVMSSGELRLYGQDMSLEKSEERLITAKSALLLPSGNVLLLSAYSAELFKF